MTGREGSGIAAPTAAGPADDRGPDAGFATRALADPGFLARFAAAYEGDDDPLDALWWLDRPDEPGPSGAVAPTAVARAARRALYGPGTDPAALERYERASAAAERSRAAAVAALGRLPVHAAPAVADAAAVDAVSPSVRPEPVTLPSAWRPLVAAAAALVVVGGAAGFGIGRAAPVPTPSPALVEHFQQTVTGSDAATVFDRAAEGADLLGGELEPLDTVNLRRLVTVGGVRFLAARTVGDGASLCLIAAEGTARTASRCASVGTFEHDGIVLTTADGLPSGFDRVRWQPDGRLVWWSPPG